MNYFSRLFLRNRRNPNGATYPNPVQNHPIPNETEDGEVAVGGGSYDYATGGKVLPLFEEEEEEDDYRTAATSSGWRISDDDDDEISSIGRRYLEANDAASSSFSSERRRRIEDDESSVAFMNGTTASSSAAMGTTSLVASEVKRNTDSPPTDDCCPICFGAFVMPCRASCGHWYCGGCILQYWNYSAALQPCSCPMCSRKITNLTPEASLILLQEAEVTEVLKNVRKYNHLFVGGTYGFILKLLELPLYVRRMFQDMMNPDRPGAHLSKLRILAMLMGLLYAVSPFDFLRIGRQNVVDVFDYSAVALSFILYLVGLYLRRRRFQRVREIAAIRP